MSMMVEPKLKRPALGKGLGALIPGATPQERKGTVLMPVEDLVPQRGQPRRHFDERQLEELAESVRGKGVLQPVLVRPTNMGFVIVAGERRWRAAQKAGLREIPVLIREMTEKESFEIALIENIQREDLNLIEEAEAYKRLIDEHGLTQEQLAERVGKERSSVTNTLRLLRLPDSIKESIVAGKLSMGHARALLAIADDNDLRKAAEKVMAENLSVRAAEALVQRLKRRRHPEQRRPSETVQVKHLIEKLQRKLGAKVELRDRGGKGTLEVRYGSLAELDRILAGILGAS